MARSGPKVVDTNGNVRFNMLMPEELYEWANEYAGKGRVAKLIVDLLDAKRRDEEEKRKLERLLKRRRVDDGVPQV